MALEEWRRGWKKQSPFLVWIDHKNLEYSQTAKQFNANKPGGPFSLKRFNFILSYRPGSKNIKPDALSHLLNPDSEMPATDI